MVRDGEPEPDFRALAELRYQIRRFLRFSERAARAAGLEPQQHQLLLAVKGLPEGEQATIGALAERLQLRHHSVVGLADRLAERGLVQRRRDEGDRRLVIVELTPEGERLLRELSRHHRAELRAAGPLFTRALAAVMEGDPTGGAAGVAGNDKRDGREGAQDGDGDDGGRV